MPSGPVADWYVILLVPLFLFLSLFPLHFFSISLFSVLCLPLFVLSYFIVSFCSLPVCYPPFVVLSGLLILAPLLPPLSLHSFLLTLFLFHSFLYVLSLSLHSLSPCLCFFLSLSLSHNTPSPSFLPSLPLLSTFPFIAPRHLSPSPPHCSS